MPQWSNSPPADDQFKPFNLVRTPATGRLTAIVTSHAVIGTNTHWFRHRTMPCEGDGCEACANGCGWRWHGYVAAFSTATHEHFIFEFPATTTEKWSEWEHAHSTLRGALFQACRVPERANGRVTIAIKPADLTRTLLPEPPDIPTILCRIWGLKTADSELQRIVKGHRMLDVGPDEDPVLLKARNNGATRTPKA